MKHFGCSKSHYKAIEYAINNNLNNIIIFEDDFIFTLPKETVNSLFNDLFNKLNTSEWDVVLLDDGYRTTEKSNHPFLEKLKYKLGSLGYIINKHYYNKMLEIFKKSIHNLFPDKKTMDNVVQYALDRVWNEYMVKDNWFIFSPTIGRQDPNIHSTIESIPYL